MLKGRHELPVRTVAVLLRREADGPEMTGVVRHALAEGRHYLEFLYDLVRIWQMSVDELLRGGIGTLPLAPIAARSDHEAHAAVRRMKQRLAREATPAEASMLWTQTDILLGLRFSKRFADELLQGVQNMRESVTYMAILEEGAAEALHRTLLRQGRKRFGPATAAIKAAIEAIKDPAKLEDLSERLLDVNSWQELLGQPAPSQATGRKRKSKGR